jgi:sterol desaturase/sphingolipid hydroxylase (fatty acid hydroxylase superfamily)
MPEALFHWFVAQATTTRFVMMLCIFVIVGAAELFAPVARVPAGGYVFNGGYAVVNAFLIAAVVPLPALVATKIYAITGTGAVDTAALGASGIAGAVFAMLMSTLILDFFYYWYHRTQHAAAVLWQEHLLHHCDAHVNVTTSGRTHIVEQFLWPAFITVPIAILFKLPPVAITAVTFAPMVWGYIVHANLRISFGPLWWLLASPQYHRIHHSLESRHINHNYAAYFPIWDVLFRTAYRPRRGEYPATGVAGVRVSTIWQAYWLPIGGWLAMIRRRQTFSRSAQRLTP